ncbi:MULTISPECIES: tyrosine-type recombinase/integrase [Rhizobium]|uniref:tyrosine-type recombinase/integrase n=1 Tax=Rhizobium TaxID=379 RepID=UPI0004269098|nr:MULTISPECIES: phage integrase SAM-like domain-containing protein [Rhizobium]UFS81516.1 site-specific integrase [Rhizobium sp. T136]
MSRRRQPPHLIWVKPKYNKETGALRANGYWAIADGTKRIGTGFGLESRADAEKARLDYEVKLYAEQSAAEIVAEHGKAVRDVLVTDLIKFYVERHQKQIEAKSKDRLRDYLNTVERLIKFWAGKTVYDVNEKTLAEYQQKARPVKPLSDNHARRELQDLKAMIHFGIKKGLCELNGHVIDWELPEPPEARAEFYTKAEAAMLVKTAYRAKNMAIGGPRGYRTSKHLARFILIGLYTGTRSEKIEQASYKNSDDRPWMDIDNGIFYRGGVANKSPLNKRADPVRIPDQLLAHLRRWAKEGSDNVIEHNGKPGSTRRGFFSLKKEVFSEERAKVVNRHTLKHTCASWLMQKRVPLNVIASYLSTTEEVILKHYGHFSPDFHAEVNDAMKADRQVRIEKAKRQAARLRAA